MADSRGQIPDSRGPEVGSPWPSSTDRLESGIWDPESAIPRRDSTRPDHPPTDRNEDRPTMTSRHSPRLAALAFVAVAAVASGGDDTPTQTVEAEGISFKAPTAWKKVTPSNPQMRKAQLRAEPAKG